MYRFGAKSHIPYLFYIQKNCILNWLCNILMLITRYQMSKRTFDSIEPESPQRTEPATKRIKKSNDLWKGLDKMKFSPSSDEQKDYISGTGIKNYLLRDPILDWFDLYYFNNCEKIFSKIALPTQQKKENDLSILFDGGNEFEDKIMEYLNHHFAGAIITINKDGRSGSTLKNYELTIKAMKDGIPIIAQGVLFNKLNRTKGIADLIVRSDYLNKLVKRKVLSSEEETLKAPLLSGDYHYRVIDIKWTTMTLCANGYTIRNDGRFPCYKGQLAIYNCAIGNIQGYIPEATYVMAKAWKIDKKNEPEEGNNCFDLLGVIQYDGFDKKYIEKIINALKWVRNVRTNGHKWNIEKPEVDEMYPNFSNKNDAPWSKIKKELCKKIDEITQVWYVTDKHRNNAHAKGIMTWKDPKCNSKTLEVSQGKRSDTIDLILDVNRKKELSILPDVIKCNLYNWQVSSPVDFYVDFETVNGCFYNPEVNILHSKTEPDIVFMIGVGHLEKNKWVYKVFCSNDISKKEELKIFDEFVDYITKKSIELDPALEYYPRLFHWTHAEVSNLNHANRRHNNKWKESMKDFIWLDMYSVFISEPIVVKGALNFKLKDIGRAMYDLKFVETLWKDEGPSDGFAAMLDAVKYYKAKSNGKDNKEVMNAIIDYNEIDCKIIWEIVKYLREHNCKPELFVHDFSYK
jgi:hypothetical protein